MLAVLSTDTTSPRFKDAVLQDLEVVSKAMSSPGLFLATPLLNRPAGSGAAGTRMFVMLFDWSSFTSTLMPSLVADLKMPASAWHEQERHVQVHRKYNAKESSTRGNYDVTAAI